MLTRKEGRLTRKEGSIKERKEGRKTVSEEEG